MGSATEAETLDQGAVTLDVSLGHVVEQATTLTDQEHQAPAAVVVVLVGFEVLGQVRDASGEDGNLDLRRAGIALGRRVLFNGLLLVGSVE
jgi:hypothetical protein